MKKQSPGTRGDEKALQVIFGRTPRVMTGAFWGVLWVVMKHTNDNCEMWGGQGPEPP